MRRDLAGEIDLRQDLASHIGTDPNRGADRCSDPYTFWASSVEIKLNGPFVRCYRVCIFTVVSHLIITFLDQRLMDLRVRYFGDSIAKGEGVTDFDSVKKEIDTVGFNELRYSSLGHS